ncbi:molybdopterin converting factor small subunit [Natronocella acetinitrilica]|uniref:Molybdopterin converting factor small subunit n=1 Tax=Natronocella acetinitrilica TaxID=414046 RepID=A0AAE3G426_9GAMM|nr:MoaD/ThiS family protein [Natronocella acetinitrilica]MCP1675400.1 molybdopterin converting factor small subunit [Natronocella acetinitrilica]
MRIRVKLFASLSDLLPRGVLPHEGFELDIDDDTTPAQLIERLRVPPKLAHLVLRNGEYIKPEQRDQPVFKDGDVFAVWPPIAGG